MSASGSIAPFLGRLVDLGAFGMDLDALGTGEGQAVVIEGEAGIGKSRLLAELCALARRRQMRVLHGVADELQAVRPFGPLIEALAGTTRDHGGQLAPWVTAVAAMAGSDRSGEVPGVRFGVLDALCDHLEQLASQEPVVLAIDDVHVADEATIMAIGALGRRVRRLALLVVVTLRPLPRSASVERMLAALEADATTFRRLGPLAQPDRDSLLAALVGACPGPGLVRQAAATGGNPLYLVELVRALGVEGAITVADGVADTATEKLPATLRLTIVRRLGYLADPTRSVLRTGAVLGTRFTLADLAVVAERSMVELADPLGEATRAGVLGEEPGGFVFSHELVREALYQELPRPLAGELHRSFARQLATSGTSATAVASQFALGARPGDDEAVEWLGRAGREAASADPAMAASFLRRAVELISPGDPLRDG
ncbi:MAG: ATP-binding protein, partial [Mycobacteriales bacterium]